MPEPITFHTPTKVSGNDGTFSETLGTARTVFGDARIDDESVRLIVDRFANVNVEDICIFDSGQYRVKRIRRVPLAPKIELEIEKVDAPVSESSI